MRALALIDGEHYPAVVRDAFDEVPYEVAGAVLLGGSEKLRGDEEYGVPLHAGLEAGLAATGAEVVLDLSDEPVAGPRRRMRLASVALARGARYVGADFELAPVAFAPFDLPSLAVIGTGKRVGKTAVSALLAGALAESRDVVVVAMGRGGPPEPIVVGSRPDLADLLERSRAGEHAASDYLEDAALSGVVTVGARRCGGGLAGAPTVTNVEAAARLAADRRPDLVVFEGSGTAIPPIATGARILVAGAHAGAAEVSDFLGPYRVLVSDLVVVTMCEPPLASVGALDELRAAVEEIKPGLPTVATVLRPRPTSPIADRRVAYFTTAPLSMHDRLSEHLAQEHGANVVLVSGRLASRTELRDDLESAAAREADVFLVELKAAAIDVVAEAADERGIEVVLAANDVVPLEGEPDLVATVTSLADAIPAKVPA